MKKLLVIGSNSFSGSNFIDHMLHQNYHIIGLSRSKELSGYFLKYKNNHKIKNFKFIKLDLNKNIKKLEKIINKFKPNFIVNFAAQGMVDQSWSHPLDWYNTNIISQVKLINFLINKKFIKKYIHFSTPEVYGNNSKTLNEISKFDPSTPYALSRMTLDLHLKLMKNYHSFPMIITRAANIYGPHQQLYRLIPNCIISILRNKPFKLDGDGKSKRSFIYMDDVSRALELILKSGKIGETYHISTKKFVTIHSIVKIIVNKINKKHKIVKVKDRMFKDKIYKLNTKKIRSKLKWKENISLDQGIENTINWIMENIMILKKKQTKYIHKK